MLKNLREIASDSVVYGSTTILAQLISLILVPFFSRELSPEEYAILSLVAMIIAFLEPIVGLGMDSALFRFFAKSKDTNERRRYFSLAFLLKSVSSIVIFVLLIPLHETVNNLIFSGKLTENNYYIFLTTFITSNIASVAFVILRADRRVKLISLINLISLIIGLGCSIYFVLILKLGVTGALYATMLATIIKALMFLHTIFKNLVWVPIDRDRFKKLVNYGIPQVPHKIQGRILSLFSLFIINEELGIATAGLYVMAGKFSKPISLVVSTVQTSWAPYKFQIHREEKDPIRVFQKIIPFYWMSLILLWAIFSMISPWVLELLIDVRYHQAIPMLPFIMMLPALEGFRFTVNTGFELSERQKMASLASFLGLAAFIVLSLMTLNYFAPFSFIVSQGIGYLIMGMVLYREARRVMVIKYPFGIIVPYYSANILIVGIFYQYYSLFAFIICLSAIIVLGILMIHKLYSIKRVMNVIRRNFRQSLIRSS